MVSIEDFKDLDIIVAKILEVKEHPNADKLYLLEVNTGEEKKQVIAGIKKDYSIEELKEKKVILLNNLESANIRGEESNGMILAAQESNTKKISLVTVDKNVSVGSRIS